MRRRKILKRTSRRQKLGIGAVLLLAIATIVSLWLQESKFESGTAYVTRVIDGDTIELANGERVRYIGIDTPERGQPFYEVAKRFNAQLVEGKHVELEFDVQQRDKYGRLLAYVYVEHNGKRVFVNAELIKQGYALAYTVPPNVKYADEFVRLQRTARHQGLGLWSEARERTASDVYIGNSRTRVFHRPECPHAARLSPKHRVTFKSRNDALDANYHPCRRCKP